MKVSFSTVKKNIISRYIIEDERLEQTKTADINVLLNRVKLGKKKESIKKFFFSAITTTSILLFCFIIF